MLDDDYGVWVGRPTGFVAPPDGPGEVSQTGTLLFDDNESLDLEAVIRVRTSAASSQRSRIVY